MAGLSGQAAMKPSLIEPYLFLNGRCEEAIQFYQSALGAQLVMLMRYDESPDPLAIEMIPAGWEKKIMHASLQVGTTTLMLSDGCASTPAFAGFALSLATADQPAAQRAFAALADAGQVTMPLDKTFWSPCFGMLTDRFGVTWMVTVHA